MRGSVQVGAAVLAAAILAGTGTAATAPPALRAGRARAQKVLAQVNALDVRFGRVVDAWDGARIHLAASKRDLAANTRALGRARRQSRVADQRLARVLVAIYENGEPTLPQILVGATSLPDLIDQLEAAQTVLAYDRQLADEALRAKDRLTEARQRLQKTERARRETLTQLSVARGQIGAMLARRRRLLTSIRSQVAALQARELAQQHALAVAAQARLEREQLLLAQQAAARAAAERAATTTTTQTTPPPPDTATTTTTSTTTDSSITAPTPALGAGEPLAATIALRYLGIPYQWGGASPATGFDCSGLVMYVYAQLGIQLPHQAAAQYTYGVAVPRDQLQPGDLVFYDGLTHVGIYIGDGEIVHAPHTGDVVKISPLSQGGATYDGARRL